MKTRSDPVLWNGWKIYARCTYCVWDLGINHTQTCMDFSMLNQYHSLCLFSTGQQEIYQISGLCLIIFLILVQEERQIVCQQKISYRMNTIAYRLFSNCSVRLKNAGEFGQQFWDGRFT